MVAIVETCLAHAALHCARTAIASSRRGEMATKAGSTRRLARRPDLRWVHASPNGTIVHVARVSRQPDPPKGGPVGRSNALAVILAPGRRCLFSRAIASKPEYRLGRRCFQASMRIQQTSLIKGGAVMPKRAHLVLRYLKLVTFLAVWIALLWSVWRLLS
jgi:hypothetical protein